MRDGYAYQRERMVRELAARGIADPRVLEALRSVPRHLFVRDQFLRQGLRRLHAADRRRADASRSPTSWRG